MELLECLHMLKEEKMQQTPCRFPCKVLLLHSREDYRSALTSLHSLCDRTISVDELFTGADLMPAYHKLMQTVQPGEWVLLPGVSAYLRLFHKSERQSGRFAQLWHSMIDATNTGRVLMPLWNCDALWYDTSLGFQSDERQKDFVFSIDNSVQEQEPERMHIRVFSAAFEGYIHQLSGKYSLLIGLREWYERILSDNPPFTDYCLLTKQTDSITPVTGDITIQRIDDTFTFVQENLQDGHILPKADCTADVLEELLAESLQNTSVRDAILHRCNLRIFDSYSIMAKWNTMTSGKKQLIKLWYRLYPDDSYLCRCMENEPLTAVEEHILLDIFDVLSYHREWLQEWQQLMVLLNIPKNESFFAKLDKLSTFEERLSFLSGNTKEERIYLLRMVGQWLQQDANQVRTAKELQTIYPKLQAYLSPLPNAMDPVLNAYIADYKRHKLANTLPDADEIFFRGIKPDTLPYRYALLQQNIDDDTAVLWIDAMGYEYLSLLLYVLEADGVGHIRNVMLAQALLPTETKYNDSWKQMSVHYEKLDKLDKLAHKGVVDDPDYYTCIEEQLQFFQKVSDTAHRMLQSYPRIIITGDHGTSRLAARFFHSRDGLPAPQDAAVCSHGRYCSVKNFPSTIYDTLQEVSDPVGNSYLVFRSYDHFTIGGFATGTDGEHATYGEIHGGATPEEMIVPVVVLESKEPLPLSVRYPKSEVRLKKRMATVQFTFNRKIKMLQVKVGAMDADCISENGKVWSVTLHKIEPGTYMPVVVADGQILSVDVPLTVVSALQGGGDL